MDKLPPFRDKTTSISIVAPTKLRISVPEVLEIAALISIVPPVSVRVALPPDVFAIAALTVNVLALLLPVVMETLVPSLSEDSIDEANNMVVDAGVKLVE